MTARAGEMTGRGYVLTWLALVILAAASLGLSFVHLGAWTFAAAMGIAALKATLVILFFMHVSHARTSVRLLLLATASFIVVLIALMVADIATRDSPGLTPPNDRLDAP